MQLEEHLPSGLCPECLDSAKAAAAFRTLCRDATNQWDSMVQLLHGLPENVNDHGKSVFVYIEKDMMTVLTNVPEEDSAGVASPLERGEKKAKRKKVMRKKCACPDCGKKFQFPKHLHEHLNESGYNRACYVCALIMPRNDLQSHLKKEHDRIIFDCKKCPALLYTSRQFKQHMDKAHAPGAYSCGDCGRSFQSIHAFHGHTSLHATKTCPSCDNLFRNYRCYLHHVKKCCNLDKTRQDVHRTKSRLSFEVQNNNTDKKVKVGVHGSADTECICDYCGKTFAGKKFVCAHIQIVHMKNTHRPCPYCSKSLAAAHMNGHIKKHEEVQMFTCEHCGVILKSKLGYVQHIRLHTGEKPYTCKYCSESFSASSRRSEHVRKVHKRSEEIVLKHVCEFCPARFRLPHGLKKHISSAHADITGSDRTFECSECHIQFGTYRGLVYHSRKHQTFDFKSSKNDLKVKVYSERIEGTE